MVSLSSSLAEGKVHQMNWFPVYKAKQGEQEVGGKTVKEEVGKMSLSNSFFHLFFVLSNHTVISGQTF